MRIARSASAGRSASGVSLRGGQCRIGEGELIDVDGVSRAVGVVPTFMCQASGALVTPPVSRSRPTGPLSCPPWPPCDESDFQSPP